jgi:photosystem II stability/assembly factor-like uncharacterized protein
MYSFTSYIKKVLQFIFIVFVHVALLFNKTAYTQWVKTAGPPGINVNTFFNSGSYLFAGTSSKGVYRSSDQGATWTAANSGVENANVLSFAKDQTYLYAGTNTGVYRSSNNGATWTVANNGIQTQLVTNMVIGGGFLFAGTAGQGVYRSPDQGNTWVNANGGALNFSSIYAMCYVNNLLIVEADNYLFKSKNAGDTWFVDQGSTAFYVIKHFLVLGDTLLASARNGIFRSYDGGKTWTNFQPVLADEYTELMGFAFSNGVVYTCEKRGMFKSTDIGVTWTPVPATGLRIGTRFNNYFSQSGNNFLMGMNELGVFRSSDTGRTWKQSIAGFPPASSIDNSLLNIHDTIVSGTHSDGVYGAINNGNFWKKVGTRNNKDTLSNAIVYTLLNPAPNIILAGTCENGLYRSADNGRTWKHIIAGLPYTVFGNYECDFGLTKSGANILLATTNGIYYSTNNGLTWNASNLTGDRISAFSIAANGSVAVAGIVEGVFPFESGIFRSVNNGVTWTFVQRFFDDIISLASDGVNNFYAGGFFGNFRSSDNGLSWANIGTGIPLNTGGFAIKVIGTNNVFIGNNTGIYFSSNKGNTFIDASAGLDPEPNNTVQGIEANSTYLFAGLPGNGVWRRRLSDFGISVPVNEQSVMMDQQNKLAGNFKNHLLIYPNPAIDKVIIEYEASQAGELQLVISDQLGRSVFQSKQFLTNGVHTSKIEVTQFLPGIYYVQVIMNGKANIEKLVVTRR